MLVVKSLAVNEDGFAFDTNTGESYTFNRCGWLVLQRLQKGENQQQIVDYLSTEFSISSNAAQRDVAEFFQQLNILGLLGEKA